ncbi:MAG: carbohydrate binding family 9 domain-containing protein [Acidobacteria bacterium]|nr:carbohydrate binding family 9 domain-containing protein [Acidobacteriota bacterium]
MLVILCVLSCLAEAHAQEARTEPVRKQARAVRVDDGAVKVDGHLEEPQWSETPAVTDFIQKEPTEGAPPTELMEFRFLYDDEALYVGARMHKNVDSIIQAPMGRRDRGEESEHIQVALDTFGDRRTAYVFGVTASGVRLDRFHPKDDEANFDEGFDPVWKAKTHQNEQEWTAELWIPFSQLRFNERDEQVWGLNIRRFTPTLNEDDYWMPVPRTVTAWSSRFGELTGIRGLPANRRLEVLPYVAGSSTMIGNRDPANPFDAGTNLRKWGGADLKMGVGPNLTLEATFNPDFGQVEADPAEVNLTAFETIFTEKRPFFTEGAGLLNFTAANNFFYSRRIGAPPLGPAVGDFVDYPRETTIIAAGKLTGRLPSGMSLGILTALTDEESSRVFTHASGKTKSVRVAPRTSYALARVQQEFGAYGSTVAGMVTAVNRNLESADPLAALLVRRAFGMAVDSTLRFKGGEYELTSYGGMTLLGGDSAAIARVQRSSAHYAQRPDRDYDRYDPTLTSLSGYKIGAVFQRTGGKHWIWSITTNEESPGFEANDMGRLNSADGVVLNGDLRYRETRPGSLFRGYWIGVRQNNEWNHGFDRQVGSLEFYSSQTWKNFWNTQLSYSRDFRRQDSRLTRGGPRMEAPRGWTLNFQMRNRTSAQTSWSSEIEISGSEDGGMARQLVGRLKFRPGPRWQLSVDPTLSKNINTQQYVTTIDGGRAETYGKRYVFAAIDRHTYSMQFRLNYTFRPDLNLDIYAEPFAASGRYYDLGELAKPSTRLRRSYGSDGTTLTRQPDGSFRIRDGDASFTMKNLDFNVYSFRCNVVLRWEYRPGSTLYFVWQQERRVSESVGTPVSIVDPFRSLTAPGNNYFIIKTSFWVPFS